eukprot:175029-Rhodomonas_salina.2
MQLSELIELEKPELEMTVSNDRVEQNIAAQSQDDQQAQQTVKEKSVRQDGKHMQIEALPDVLSLLKNLREGSQISDSAHQGLSKAFEVLSKNQETVACHLDEDDGRHSPSERRDPEMPDERVITAAGIKAPKRTSASRPFKHPSSRRQQLTLDEAAEIYSMRPEFAKGSTLRRGCMVKSKMIAPLFGVTPKTVRDIWHARTWVLATRHLWTEEEIAYRAKGGVESEDEDRTSSTGSVSPTASMDNMTLHSLAHNWIALSSLQNQPSTLGGIYGLPFHLPLPSSPSALAYPFSARQQHAEMSQLLSHGIFNTFAAQQTPMAFPGCHSRFGMGRTGCA